MTTRIENQIGARGEGFIRAVQAALATLPDTVVFDRVSIDEELVGDSLLVRVTVPSSRPGLRKQFLVRKPAEAQRELLAYFKRKYGALATDPAP